MSVLQRSTSVLLAWAVFAMTVAIAIFALAVTLFSARPLGAGGSAVAIAWLAYAAVGVVISTRRPGDRIGALLLAMGLSAELLMAGDVALGVVGGGSLVTISELDPVLAWVLPLLLNLWAVSFNLLAVLLLVFPTGHVLSPRWRPLVWLTFALIPLGMITAGTSREGAEIAAISTFPLLEQFFGDAGSAMREAGQGIFGISQLTLTAVAASSLVIRYRRARGVERQQLKWLAYAALLFAAVSVGTAVIFFSPLRALDPGAPIPPAVFGGIPFILGLVAIPVAVGVAILRYRLYDIDLLINRTLVYGAVTALLAATYFGAVVLIQAALRPFTSGSELAVAGSTLLVVALFQPLRRRVQEAVDRRFYRSRYDAGWILDRFGSRLRDQVDLDAVRADLLDILHETVRPAHATVWLRTSARADGPWIRNAPRTAGG